MTLRGLLLQERVAFSALVCSGKDLLTEAELAQLKKVSQRDEKEKQNSLIRTHLTELPAKWLIDRPTSGLTHELLLGLVVIWSVCVKAYSSVAEKRGLDFKRFKMLMDKVSTSGRPQSRPNRNGMGSRSSAIPRHICLAQ